MYSSLVFLDLRPLLQPQIEKFNSLDLPFFRVKANPYSFLFFRLIRQPLHLVFHKLNKKTNYLFLQMLEQVNLISLQALQLKLELFLIKRELKSHTNSKSRLQLKSCRRKNQKASNQEKNQKSFGTFSKSSLFFFLLDFLRSI